MSSIDIKHVTFIRALQSTHTTREGPTNCKLFGFCYKKQKVSPLCCSKDLTLFSQTVECVSVVEMSVNLNPAVSLPTFERLS